MTLPGGGDLLRTYLPLLGAYLLGSIPFGLLIARAKGIDLRTFGSGNIGATNAMRAVGKPLGILVFLLDAAKGFAPTFVCLKGWGGLPHGPGWAVVAGTVAVLGHCFPVWLGFRTSGKGVATGCGVWLALSWPAALVTIAVFGLTLAATRYVALASVAASCSLPLTLKVAGAEPEWLILAAGAMAGLVTFRHKANFVRMAAGVEPKAGGSKP